MGIETLPPDINESFGYFSVANDKIRFGFRAIKNVGTPTIRAIIEERGRNGAFTGLTDFVTRLCADLNKRAVLSLISAGVFDSLGGTRKQYTLVYERIMNGVNSSRRSTMEGQLNLFDLSPEPQKDLYKDDLPRDAGEFPKKQLLASEKEVVGLYLSGHPISEYQQIIDKHGNCSSRDFISSSGDDENADGGGAGISDGGRVRFLGIVMARQVKYTKANRAMAFLTLEDYFGSVEAILFPDVYDKFEGEIEMNEPILAVGRASVREDEDAKILVDELLSLSALNRARAQASPVSLGEKMWLKLSADRNINNLDIQRILERYPGDTRVILYDEETKRKIPVSDDFRVDSADGGLLSEMLGLLGDGAVVVK